jgi:cytochrome c-type biogenesis protein CcmF
MIYEGEHLWAGELGRFAVSLAFGTALLALVAYALTKRDRGWKKIGNIAFGLHAASIFTIVGTLFFMMSQHYFEYDYVWKHTSLDLPPRYLFSAFWEGQEGSFLLWMFWHAVLGLILLFGKSRWKGPVLGVIATVQAFLVSMIMGIYPWGVKVGQSPFVLIREMPENIGMPWTTFADYLTRFPNFADGSGLNPLLQNYWMTIHPPTLFLGFASTLIPFAFAIAALLNKDYKGWIKPVLPWAFFSVMILGTGILMGGAWAYEALSFGGFWAWDPVENSSLVPWLTMVGAAHLILVQKNKGGVLPSSFFLTIISFLLILYSTFLTRSGVLGDSSVHAFVDLGLSGQLLIYLLFFVVISLGLLIWRYRALPKPKSEETMDSREFWIFIASMVFLLSSLQITISTSMPVFNKLFGPEGWVSLYDNDKTIADPIDHYNSFQVPFAIILTLLVSMGQFLSYRKTSTSAFLKKIRQSLIASLVLTIAFAWGLGMTNPLYIFLLFTSAFAILGNLDYWLRVARGAAGVSASSIAHVGFGLIILGALISNANKKIISQNRIFIHEEFPANENLLVELEDTVEMKPYWVTYTGEEKGEGSESHYNYYNLEFYKENADSTLAYQFSLRPSIQKNERMGNVPEPSTKHYLNRDVYTHITYADLRTEEEKNSEWKDEAEMRMEPGGEGQLIYGKYLVTLDSVVADVQQAPDGSGFNYIVLGASLRIQGLADTAVRATPLYIVQNNEASSMEAVLDDFDLKLSFTGIDHTENKPIIKVWRKRVEEQPFIIVQAIVFPMINLLWLGCVLMAIGTAMAVWKRIKPGTA